VSDAAALGVALAELCADPAARERLGAAARGVVEAQRGATDLTWRALGPLLAERPARAAPELR
jgi:3-deoxy-D-manno-octulosonic-acid transferase